MLRSALPWLALAGLAALIGWGLWPKPISVETGEVTRAALTVHIAEEGKTRIRNRYTVSAPAAGLMRRITLKPGDSVQAGQTLITTLEPVTTPLIDPRTLTQARAAIGMHQANRQRALQSLAAARAALTLAEADRDRMRAVRTEGSLSQSDRDRMEAEASIKAAEVRAAEFALQVIDHELAQAQAAVDRPRLQDPGNQIEIRSPVSGQVLKVLQESEASVSPGQPLIEIGDRMDLEVEAEILSRDAVGIQPGDAVEIDHWGGDTLLKGRVRRVEPAAFTKISALGVEEQRVIVLCDLIDPPSQAQALGDRFRVEVRVAVWHAPNALVVPAGALFRVGADWKTFLYRDGSARLVTVSAGRSDGRRTEVLSGLNAGDQVLLHPPDTVRDGSPVTTPQND